MITRRGIGLALFVTPCMTRAATILDQLPEDPVYTGQAIVTGTDRRDRPRGLALCLGQVLIKATGDPNILAAPGFPALRAEAADMVRAISYHDRMSALPKHDEQGTRDRPFTLSAEFDRSKIADAAARLGDTIWKGRRPTVFLTTHIRGYSGNFLLNSGPDTGYEQLALMRAAVADAAATVALPFLLPRQENEAAPPGTLAITGSLTWSDAAYGWLVQWLARRGSESFVWKLRGVSFDAAFYSAFAGALGIASGHRPPQNTN